jgi:hypothetical protein
VSPDPARRDRLIAVSVAPGAGVVLLVAIFLPWFTLDGRAVGISRTVTGNALDFGLASAGSLLTLAGAAAFAGLVRGGRRRSLPVWMLPAAGAVIGAVLLLVQAIAGYDPGWGAVAHRRFGLWLGLGAAWLAAGAVMMGSRAVGRPPGPAPPPPD